MLLRELPACRAGATGLEGQERGWGSVHRERQGRGPGGGCGTAGSEVGARPSPCMVDSSFGGAGCEELGVSAVTSTRPSCAGKPVLG